MSLDTEYDDSEDGDEGGDDEPAVDAVEVAAAVAGMLDARDDKPARTEYQQQTDRLYVMLESDLEMLHKAMRFAREFDRRTPSLNDNTLLAREDAVKSVYRSIAALFAQAAGRIEFKAGPERGDD